MFIYIRAHAAKWWIKKKKCYFRLCPTRNTNYGVFVILDFYQRKTIKSLRDPPDKMSMRCYIVSNRLILPLWVGEWFLFYESSDTNFIHLNSIICNVDI